MKTSVLKTLACLFIIISACQKETPFYSDSLQDAGDASDAVVNSTLILPQSDHFDSIPQDPLNPLTPEKVALGKLLFHETRLGGNSKFPEGLYTYSCASCHHAEAGFQSGLAQGIGDGGVGFGFTGEARVPSSVYPVEFVDVQPIRTPTVLNSAYQEVMLWDGEAGATGVNAGTQYAWTAGTSKENNFLGYRGLETVGIGALKKHRFIVDTDWLSSTPEYKDLFDQAFPDLPAEQRISSITISLAIAAYERTLLPNQAPFQRWLKGERKALTPDENMGRGLFFGKAKCGRCHAGPALNSMAFYSLGMSDLQGGVNGVVDIDPNANEDRGRGGFTQKKADLFKFKVPQLYNLRDVKFFGHGSSFTSVTDVVKYINNGVPQNQNIPTTRIAKQFVPLGLTDDEIGKIVQFIENGLYDPNLSRYGPAGVPSGNCIPNNDAQSKADRGCL
jgi:cytochrome c peroxidase